ncbi:type II secretion system protein GspG [bacterium]|nr:type II secretion system protein GspG [bacterium]
MTTQLRRFMHGGVAVDAWGNPIYYRCPGPVHKHGFDLISCGPNGVHEEGQGDDILVGEDLPGGLASIESGSAAAVGSGTRGK